MRKKIRKAPKDFTEEEVKEVFEDEHGIYKRKKRAQKIFLPSRFQWHFGDLTPNKGATDDGNVILYVWDYVQECEGDTCPLRNLCKYCETQRKCKIVADWLKSAMNIIFRNYDDEISEPQLYKVGTLLVPIYKMLVKLYMEEVTIRRISETSANGTIRIHPIYKEIRETIKSAIMIWHSLGLKGTPDMPGPVETDDDDFQEQSNTFAQREGTLQ